VYHDDKETKTWLLSNTEGYSVDNTNILSRNALPCTASKIALKSDDPYMGISYRIGVDPIGNTYWKFTYSPEAVTTLFVVAPSGIVEMRLNLPPGPGYVDGDQRYNIVSMTENGFIYYLEAPYHVPENSKDSLAVLYKVKSHLALFGKVNDANVRLRAGPSTNDDILQTLDTGMGMRILEEGKKKETIGAFTSNWKKVRLTKDGTIGWVFGAFITGLVDK
jgi:hypothetical protein